MSENQVSAPKRPMAYLHCHSMYSVLDGFSSPADIAAQAKEMGYSAVALTDHGTCGGLYKFQAGCKKAGIKPILGVETYFVDDISIKTKDQDRWHLTLWAKNKVGYRNMIRLSTAAFLDGFYSKPRIDFEMLRRHSEGLIVGSACAVGIMCGPVLAGKPELAEKYLAMFSELFRDDFYVEIMTHNFTGAEAHKTEEFRKAMREIHKMAKKRGVKSIITGDAHYCKMDDAKAHDVVLSVSTRDTIKNPRRFTFSSNDFYIHPASEYVDKLPESFNYLVDGTMEIANKVEPDLIETINDSIPKIASIPEGVGSEEDYLRMLVRDGMTARGLDGKPEYEARIKEEMDVIVNCGFVRYFLVLWDFVRYARQAGVMVGSGRGSGVASLCLYCLRITGLDPIKYDLMFARFLSKDRISPPDVDIDFDARKREEMFTYLKKTYGNDCVSRIGTYGSLKARDAVRRVGKALDVGGDWDPKTTDKHWESGPKTLALVDRIAKTIPNIPDMTLDKAIELSREQKAKGVKSRFSDEYFCDYADKYPELLEYAKRIEGRLCSEGVHASGVLISKTPLIDLTPLRMTSDADGGGRVISTQFDMKDVEESGLLKFDILAIKTLSVISDCVKLIEKHTGEKIPIDTLPPDDKRVFAMLNDGDTQGIFQFEGKGITDLLRSIRVDRFEDMIVCNAMFRPGTLKARIENVPLTELYCDYKHGRKAIKYLHPVMEEVLKDTYGFMVYQEQVMLISMKMAGFTPGEADGLRKAMGKKNKDKMAKAKSQFIDGCIKNGYTAELSDKMFELCESFAGYGFNKAHAAAYSYLAYQTAWLKCYYRKYFMCALLSSVMASQSEDDRLRYESDCRAKGISILDHHINHSKCEYVVEDGGIRRPLTSIKGVGEKAAEPIVQAQPFKDIRQFFLKVTSVNHKVFELLVNAGSMEVFGEKKSDLLSKFEQFRDGAKKMRKVEERDAAFETGDLFNHMG